MPAAIPKHTDQCYRHTPLGINFLQCVKTSGVGGETVLGDAFEIARVLRETDPEAFALLTTVPIQYYRYIEGKAAYYSEACVICVDHLGDVVGFRYSNRQTSAPLDLPAELVEPMHDALRKLSALMRHPDFEIQFLLEPGDILAYDNQRVIHGRTLSLRRSTKRCRNSCTRVKSSNVHHHHRAQLAEGAVHCEVCCAPGQAE